LVDNKSFTFLQSIKPSPKKSYSVFGGSIPNNIVFKRKVKDKVLISMLFSAWEKEVKKVKNLKGKIIHYFSPNKT